MRQIQKTREGLTWTHKGNGPKRADSVQTNALDLRRNVMNGYGKLVRRVGEKLKKLNSSDNQ